MNLNNVVAVRNIKTVYRDGDKAIKVFNEDYSKADVLNEALKHTLLCLGMPSSRVCSSYRVVASREVSEIFLFILSFSLVSRGARCS